MKRELFILLLFSVLLGACSQKKLPVTVSQEKMGKIYSEIKTPYKYGLVLVPDSNSYKMDCPTIFRKDNKWVMTYIVFDGRGYETWLAQSVDLLHWDIKGKIMSFSSDTTQWDANQKAGYASLIDYDWGGDYAINQYNGKYWMSYFGGNSKGYERGILSIGMAYTTQNPATVHEWKRLKKQVLTPIDTDAQWYDNSTIYKNFVIEDHKKHTGHSFVMYYNARGDSINPDRGAERISMAVSDDMVHWERYGDQPLINHHIGISGDAVFQKIGDTYVMFYFGAFWPDQDAAAFNRFACSYDMIHWTEWDGPNLIEPSEEYDALFAHKSYVLKHNGIVYHFYNAVDKLGNRGIALATSKNIGKSSITFNSDEESTIK
jgi:predicted GH43/DUF377 family glycosyl hydrolase